MEVLFSVLENSISNVRLESRRIQAPEVCAPPAHKTNYPIDTIQYQVNDFPRPVQGSSLGKGSREECFCDELKSLFQ